MSIVMELNMQLILELFIYIKVYFWLNKAILDNDLLVLFEFKSFREKKINKI